MKKKKANPNYKHKEGGDDLVDLPEDLAFLEVYGITAHKFGEHIFLRGAGFDSKIIDEFLRKRNNKESIVIAVTGPPGTGKTYFGMMLAMILDPKFNIVDTPPPDPKDDKGQLAFKRQHILFLTGPNSPLKRGQVIELDETHFGVGSRTWGNKDQQALTNYIAAIRSKGIILILVVLHTTMLDKMVRDYVINYEIHVTDRGIGTVYRRWFPQFGDKVFKKRLGKLVLPMPDADICNYPTCLGCKHMSPKKHEERCITLRAIYERRKEDFLNEQATIDQEKNKESDYNTFDEIIEGIRTIKELIPRKGGGAIHQGKCAEWIKTLGYRVRDREKSVLMDKIKNTYG